MIVNQLLVSVVSTNFDNRSFRLNDRATLTFWDATFAAQQTAVFDDDLKRSKLISLAAWRNRPLRQRLADRLTSVIGSQL